MGPGDRSCAFGLALCCVIGGWVLEGNGRRHRLEHLRGTLQAAVLVLFCAVPDEVIQAV